MYGGVKGELTHYAETKDDDAGRYTHYAAITGEGTAFPSVGMKMADPMSLPLGGQTAGVSRFGEMPDGHGNVILIGPVDPGRKIPWTKPEDLAFRLDFPAPGHPGGFGAPYKMKDEQGKAVGYAHLLLGDGAIRTFPKTVDAARFRKLLMIGDGSKVDPVSLAVNPERGRFYDLTLELTRDGGRWSARLDPVGGVQQGLNER
jgi:hypothetical protein